MIKSIMKRDGRVVLYDESKIASAILKALEAAREGDASVAAQVANSVEARLEELCSDGTPQIEQIQDTVEQELETIRAQWDGIVLYHTLSLGVSGGDMLVTYGQF